MKKILVITITSLLFFVSSGYALNLKLPNLGGNTDVVGTRATIDGKPELVTEYIKLANQYLRRFMVVVSFVVLVWMGIKLITSPSGTGQAREILKNGITGLGVGIFLILLSYTLVRIVLNLL